MSLQFAQFLFAKFRPRVLLNLGCGTGETLAAMAEVAAARTPLTTAGFVDALEGMTMAAGFKVAQTTLTFRSAVDWEGTLSLQSLVAKSSSNINSMPTPKLLNSKER